MSHRISKLIQSLFFFSSRRRHTRYIGDWSSDVCSSDLERGDVRSAAASSLPSLTKKNLACAGSHRLETGWRPPVPTLLPAPLLKPREAGRDVGHIQDRGNGFCFHGEKG